MKRSIFAIALVVLTLSFSAIAFAGANFQLASYELTSPTNYQLRFRGRSWNANNMNEITGIHVYIGGGVGAGGQMIGEFRTDQNHNFDVTLTVPQNRSGNQLVVIYAVNGIESKELDRRNVNVMSGNQRANFQLSSYELTSPANYKIRLHGRSWNASNMNEITGIHVYIGGGVGAGGQMIGEFRTDQNHNFDVTIDSQNRSGNQLVVIYAVNGIESKELDRRNVNILPSNQPSGNYDSKVQSFINDSRFRHGTSWTAGQPPILDDTRPSSGCNAYARDFVKYVFGIKLKQAGSTQFTNINEIRAGDVIYVSPSDHWIVVLYRNGDILTTAEGNWPAGGTGPRQVVIGDIYYKIQNGNIYHRNRANQNYSYFRPFQYGYHHQ